MRVMVIVKANKDSEAGVLPSREILSEMGKLNEELVKAGVMLAGEGLHSSASRRARTEPDRARNREPTRLVTSIQHGVTSCKPLPTSTSRATAARLSTSTPRLSAAESCSR